MIDKMFRTSNKLFNFGIASMPQSKLSCDGYKSNLKLTTGKWVNVKNRVQIEFDFATGLSAVENSTIGPGSSSLN